MLPKPSRLVQNSVSRKWKRLRLSIRTVPPVAALSEDLRLAAELAADAEVGALLVGSRQRVAEPGEPAVLVGEVEELRTQRQPFAAILMKSSSSSRPTNAFHRRSRLGKSNAHVAAHAHLRALVIGVETGDLEPAADAPRRGNGGFVALPEQSIEPERRATERLVELALGIVDELAHPPPPACGTDGAPSSASPSSAASTQRSRPAPRRRARLSVRLAIRLSARLARQHRRSLHPQPSRPERRRLRQCAAAPASLHNPRRRGQPPRRAARITPGLER